MRTSYNVAQWEPECIRRLGAPMTMLRCDALSKRFDGTQALVGVPARFPASGIIAVIGPNGAGKTTLINVLTGSLMADSGRCFLGDRDITRLRPHRVARLGLTRTFQDLRLIRQVSVLENVMLARPNQRGEKLWAALVRFGTSTEEACTREASLRTLELVGLRHKAGDLAGEISYGQQKLLALACCLATEPRVLLLDEPVAGVHPELVGRILELMRELRDGGRLIIFVEHDIAAVRQVADSVIVMDDGRIIAQGPPDQVLQRPEIMEAYVG